MDNTNPNNPSDPNLNNPFNSTPQNAPTTPIAGDIPTSTPMNNPVPSTPMTPPAPTDPASFLNNPAPTNTYTPPTNINPMPLDQTSPTNTTSPWDQTPTNVPATTGSEFLNSLNSNTQAAPITDQAPATTSTDTLNTTPNFSNPNPGYQDPAMSNPTPNLDINPAPFNQNPAPPPANPDPGLNLGGMGSTNSQFSMPTPQAPIMENPTPANTSTPEPSIVDPNLIVQPTTGAPEFNNNASPSNNPQASTYNPMIPEQEAPKTAEPAPTDLSHLIDPAMNINANSQVYTPSLSQQPETLVVPGNGSEVSTTATTSSSSRHIPKWVIGLGIALLLVVAGISGYLILGIGQQSAVPTPASLPAQQSQLQPPPETLPSLPNSQPTTSSPSAETGSFGQLSGTPSASASPRSAADLLRQNQQSQ